jgi:hypothetical protein
LESQFEAVERGLSPWAASGGRRRQLEDGSAVIRLVAAALSRTIEISGLVEDESAYGIEAVFKILKLIDQSFGPWASVDGGRKFVDGAAASRPLSVTAGSVAALGSGSVKISRCIRK